jgi:hypothetical protein
MVLHLLPYMYTTFYTLCVLNLYIYIYIFYITCITCTIICIICCKLNTTFLNQMQNIPNNTCILQFGFYHTLLYVADTDSSSTSLLLHSLHVLTSGFLFFILIDFFLRLVLVFHFLTSPHKLHFYFLKK